MGQQGITATARSILAAEGVRGFYAGLTAQLLRAWTYAPARFGVYLSCASLVCPAFPAPPEDAAARRLTEALTPEGATSLPFIKRVGCGLVSGAAAAIISNPAEVAIVRMQVDKSLPAAERRNYRNVGDALVRAGKEEGLRALWKGSAPNALRAMALNCGALASRDQTKEAVDALLGTTNGVSACVGGAMMSGIVGAFFSIPFDSVKTQLQRMQPNDKGVM